MSESEVDWAFEDSKRYPISNDYQIGRDLGEGKFSVVRYATHKQNGVEVAIKCIDRINTNPDELVHEAMLMQLVEDHPGVIKIRDVYEDSKYFYLVTEFIAGGELFDRIVENDSYTEKEAATVIRQIATIVQFIHSKNVVHRDIKPENLLYVDKDGTALKLCDFGLADTIEEDELLTAIVGSTTYMAPEVARGIGYDKSVDIYSIGVILYILLCGYPPFEPEAGIVDLEFPIKEWAEISKPVIELIKNMLSSDPSKRPNATQLLQHPWIRGEAVSSKQLTGTIKTIKKFQIAHKTGQTMRTKDPLTKATVFNIFDEPPPMEKKPSEKIQKSTEKDKKDKDDKKKDKDDKKKDKQDKKTKKHKDDKKKKDKPKSQKLKGIEPPPTPAVSFASDSPRGDQRDEEIKFLQQQIDDERKKIKQLEARIAELEKKDTKKKKTDKKKK